VLVLVLVLLLLVLVLLLLLQVGYASGAALNVRGCITVCPATAVRQHCLHTYLRFSSAS
jgi:hypothetical protein